MVFYPLLFTSVVLVGFRFLRSQKIEEKLLLAILAFFLAFTLAVHPWITESYFWLKGFEIFLLVVLSLWLLGEPLIQSAKNRRRRLKVPLSEIALACQMLSESRQGGLIAIERKASLEGWIRSGIPLDALIRRETVYSVFTPPGALHDGGMIIRGERIVACGALFPLSKRFDLPTDLGTRHRAALGLSEVTDALMIIVSEETGKISLASVGSLFYDIQIARLDEMLEKAFRNQLVRTRTRGQVLSFKR